MPKVGVVCIQGDFEKHLDALRRCGVAEPVQVRTPEDLKKVGRIILPGGESTTMLKLLKSGGLWAPLQDFVRERPTWGICAGAILLADEVVNPAQESLKALKITVERNSYGRQNESFIDRLIPTEEWKAFSSSAEVVEGIFIRAPRIRNLGPEVKVILEHNQEPVMVQQGKCLASTFHPELTSSTLIHQYFLKQCQ